MHCKIFAKKHEEIISVCACNLHFMGMTEVLISDGLLYNYRAE